MSCPHPSTARETPNGYDVVCGDCQSLVGTVALFPAAVLRQEEAREVLRMLGDVGEGSGVKAKLTRAACIKEARAEPLQEPLNV